MELAELLATAPKFRAHWRPVYFESIPGSGERFTVGILAKGEGGEAAVRMALRPNALTMLYGAAGAALQGAMNDAIREMHWFLKNGGDWRAVPLKLSNLSLGEIRIGLGHSMEDLLEQACRMSASLAAVEEPVEDTAEPDLDDAIRDFAHRVEADMVRLNGSLVSAFQFKIYTNQRERPEYTVGFFHERAAANFGVLRHDYRRSADVVRIKSRLWDLETLRDAPLIFQPQKLAMVLGHPALDAPGMTNKSAGVLRDKIDMLCEQSERKHIHLITATGHEEAAAKLLEYMAKAA